ncbi:hypothetical protein HZR84_08780 [Hyphobacterium sp. CCMP332]|nr:hypothetical protein HZR84_08780 [Hyphobacterium sp. CCMP332]
MLLKKGQWEYKLFNNLYTQTKSFNSGRKADNGNRQNYFSSIHQFLYGVSTNLNIGIDVWFKSVHVQANPKDNPLRTFRFNHENSDFTITGIGPKIKIAPFNKIKRLSIQTTILFPIRDDLENSSKNKAFLEFDRDALWITQIFFDKPIGNDFQLFFQLAPWYTFSRNSFRERNFMQTPTSVFFSWFANDRLTFYFQNEYWPTHYNSSEQSFEAFYSWFNQSGFGIKYQLIPGFLEIESLYTNFWIGSDGEGAGETYNLGIRIIN